MMRDPYDPFRNNTDAHDLYGKLNIYANKIDHFVDDPYGKTFAQRYWVNDTYATDTGPVILYLCGEWTCRATNPDTNPATALAIKHNGTVISLEHRFYGASQPFSDADGGWSYNNLKYLNTTQALADVASFIDYYKKHK